MVVSKSTAQNKANETASEITAAGGTSCTPPAIANNATATLQQVANACNQRASDNQDVNTDATIGNIALGVSVVAAVSTVVYWLVADRHDDSPSSGSTRPILTPIVGRSEGGLSLSGSF
jgi:hypothetical protein